MSKFYQSLIIEIRTSLATYGRPATLKKKVNSGVAYNPTVNEQTYPIIVVTDNYNSNLIDGTVIRKGDIQFFVGCDIEIHQSDIIVDGVDEYSIVDIQLIKPGDTKLLYIIQARK